MQSIRRTAPGPSPVVGEQMRLPSQMEPVVPLSAQRSGSLQTGSGGMQREGLPMLVGSFLSGYAFWLLLGLALLISEFFVPGVVAVFFEIGRASCRERVEVWVVAVSLK